MSLRFFPFHPPTPFLSPLSPQDDRWLMKCEQIFKFCFQTINALVKDQPELSLRLFLHGALVADRIDNETIVYEFFSQVSSSLHLLRNSFPLLLFFPPSHVSSTCVQAFTLYEEEVTDSRAQQAAITFIIVTLEQLSSLGEENHETLRSNCAMSYLRLLKKPVQCRSVATCAHVFWLGHFTQEDREVIEVITLNMNVKFFAEGFMNFLVCVLLSDLVACTKCASCSHLSVCSVRSQREFWSVWRRLAV